jgi:hypothetical protein
MFDGVELVDRMSQLKYTTKLMKYVELLMKMPIAKPIKLKKAATPQ